jgi:hypothetical protein
MMIPAAKVLPGKFQPTLNTQKMNDITKGLESAIAVVDKYQIWIKGIDSLFFEEHTYWELGIALEVVIEAAKVLITMEQVKNQQTAKK